MVGAKVLSIAFMQAQHVSWRGLTGSRCCCGSGGCSHPCDRVPASPRGAGPVVRSALAWHGDGGEDAGNGGGGGHRLWQRAAGDAPVAPRTVDDAHLRRKGN